MSDPSPEALAQAREIAGECNMRHQSSELLCRCVTGLGVEGWESEPCRLTRLIAHALDAAAARARDEQREAGIRECAGYVRKCGTASHPVGYGDWCGGEIDPIKLLTGIADVLDRRADALRHPEPSAPAENGGADAAAAIREKGA